MSRRHTYSTTCSLPLPREQVFPFFADATNLERITPPELSFHILSETPIEMRAGALIRYRLRLMGIPFEWLTRIAEWNPPDSFVDEQLKGPYKTWVHTHRFVERDGGTRIDDDVVYELPLFPFGEVAAPLVSLQVRRIFTFRTLALRRALGLGD